MHKNRHLYSFIFSMMLIASTANAWQADLTFIGKSKGDTMRVFVSNTQDFPQTLSLKLQFSDMRLIGETPEYIVVPPKAVDYVVAKLFMTARAASKLTWNDTQYFMGDITAAHNDKYIYTLPYQKGAAYQVSKAPNSNDQSSPNNSLRFPMEEGTIVRAARAGKVLMAQGDSETGCAAIECASFANYIIILHDDGTMAAYSHLMKDGVTVKVGQTVKTGQTIGKSGNTGWTSSPRLQFEVFKANQTIAIKFKTGKKTSGFLENGLKYKSR